MSAMPARIVCLVPSITELLCDLGLAEQLVGRTGFCVHPWEVVRTVPKVGGTKDVKLDRVRALRPTHVVVNVDENRRETAEALAEFVPHVVVTHPLGPLDNPPLYRQLGGIFGRAAAAERLCEQFAAAYAELAGGVAPDGGRPGGGRPDGGAPPGRAQQDVLYLIWREPWMTVSPDTYISRTLALAGWRTLPRETEQRYPAIALEAFAGRVERVLLSSEPYHFKQHHLAEVAALVPGAEVSLIDGEMTSWYGSRAIAGLRHLAAIR